METSEVLVIEIGIRARYPLYVESGSVTARSPSSIRRYRKEFREEWRYNMETWWDVNTGPLSHHIKDSGAFEH